MQYEYIGHVPNKHDFVKGKRYNVNPRRDNGLVLCNVQEVTFEHDIHIAKPIIRDLIYDSVEDFRHDWNVVSAELIKGRVEPAELAK